MELEQIKPEMGSFGLEAFPGIQFHLRKISLNDKIWAKQTFGKSIEEVLNKTKEEIEGNYEEFLNSYSRIAYHLIQEDQKVVFVSREVPTIDENGIEGKIKIGGVKLFQACVQGIEEQLAVMRAVGKTLMASNVLPEEEKKILENPVAQKVSA